MRIYSWFVKNNKCLSSNTLLPSTDLTKTSLKQGTFNDNMWPIAHVRPITKVTKNKISINKYLTFKIPINVK